MDKQLKIKEPGLWEIQDGHLAFPSSLKKTSFLFDGIKPSLGAGLMSSQWGKKKLLKMYFPPGVYFLQSPVIKAPTSLDKSYKP